MPAVRDHDAPADLPRSILAGTHPRGTRSPSRGTRTRGDDLAGVFHRPGTNPPSPLRGRGSQTAGGERLSHCTHGRQRRGEGSLDASPLPGGRAVQCESIRYGQSLPGSAADSFPGRAGLAIQRYDRGNVGDGHRLVEPKAYTIRRGRALLVDSQPAVFRPAPLGGRPDPDPPLRTSVQPARRGDPISFRPHRTGVAPRLDSPAGKGAAIPSGDQRARSGRRATLQEAVGFVRRPTGTVEGTDRTVLAAGPSDGRVDQ